MSLLAKKIIETDKIRNSIFSDHGKVYTFLNPVSYLDAVKFKDLYSNFDGIFADGSLMVAFIRLFYFKKVKRCSFDMTSLADELFNYCLKENKSIYIVASADEEVKKSVELIKENYDGINIIGFRSGYFASSTEMNIAAEEAVRSNADFLIVGMGVIKQEQFLLNAKNIGFKGIGFTCGGFISQTAKNDNSIDYYPKWIDRCNLRFAYRMYKEPHTRVRYLKAGFLFPFRFLWDRIFL